MVEVMHDTTIVVVVHLHINVDATIVVVDDETYLARAFGASVACAAATGSIAVMNPPVPFASNLVRIAAAFLIAYISSLVFAAVGRITTATNENGSEALVARTEFRHGLSIYQE